MCTTELGTVAKLKDEFDRRNVKVIGLSVDPVDSHLEWAKDIEETQGKAVNFPMIADPDRKVADLYDMIHPNANDTLTVRSVFVIGADNKVKLTLTYPASTGRNFDEILRVIDSLQLTATAQGGHAGELDRRRQGDHRAGAVRRRGQGAVPAGMGRAEAVPAPGRPAGLTPRSRRIAKGPIMREGGRPLTPDAYCDPTPSLAGLVVARRSRRHCPSWSSQGRPSSIGRGGGERARRSTRRRRCGRRRHSPC